MAGIVSKSLDSWIIRQLLNEADNEAHERYERSTIAPHVRFHGKEKRMATAELNR
jgi:hypothetical protein